MNGKAVRFRDTWVLEDGSGQEVANIREKKLSIRNSITIDVGGRQATVKKALVGLRDATLVLAATVAVDALSHDLG